LSWQDNDKFGGGGNVSMSMDDDGNVNYEWTGGNNDEEPNVDTQNGFIKNTNAGVQYSNKWNDKHTLNSLNTTDKTIKTIAAEYANTSRGYTIESKQCYCKPC
jgi:hypothetical protein